MQSIWERCQNNVNLHFICLPTVRLSWCVWCFRRMPSGCLVWRSGCMWPQWKLSSACWTWHLARASRTSLFSLGVRRRNRWRSEFSQGQILTPFYMLLHLFVNNSFSWYHVRIQISVSWPCSINYHYITQAYQTSNFTSAFDWSNI